MPARVPRPQLDASAIDSPPRRLRATAAAIAAEITARPAAPAVTIRGVFRSARAATTLIALARVVQPSSSPVLIGVTATRPEAGGIRCS
jgi:hypothetical protein